MSKLEKILYISTGGTIDKGYPRNIRGYAFEFQDPPAALQIFQRAKIGPFIEILHVKAFAKDSQEITEEDRAVIEKIVSENPVSRVLLTHGTDTILETATFLQKHFPDRIFVLTGSFLPAVFRDSDAEFNLGMALGAVQSIREPGAYVALQGLTERCDRLKRNLENGDFERIQ
ncbi:unnamed protein product, partial [Mesorhabditis belari]|uniref:L-asparaginase N-terminal domain-containing protein n=1 Tax=Mesorhabditis belari TaxID=2138241 RepID=A0AAF3FGD3_9BILA